MLDDIKSHNKYIGLKQSLRAIEHDEVFTAYVANDSAPHIYNNVVSKCAKKGIPVEYVETMKELGDACNIDVGAAVVVLLK
jgi:large subunit ribosomal protein L7A